MHTEYYTQIKHTPTHELSTTWTPTRKKLVNKFGWGIPTPSVIQDLVNRSTKSNPILEIGAGNGYLASCVQTAGGHIIPTDINPPENTWTKVYKHSYTDINPESVHTLALIWPPANSPIATNILTHCKPDTLCFMGKPNSTITGNTTFHEHISNATLTKSTTINDYGPKDCTKTHYNVYSFN